MTEASESQSSKPNTAQELVEVGKRAFDPSLDNAARAAGLQEYNKFINETETWALLPALNSLIKPNVLPPWLSQAFMQTLTLLPLRPDGVRGTMEFVFSVHPTSHESQTAGSSAPQKQGSSITHEAVAVATKLLSSVPASLTPQAWFQGIAGQLFHLMDGKDGPDLARTAAQIVGFGILGKRQWGAPDAPGWNAFVQPLIQDINPSLRKDPTDQGNFVKDEVVDLSSGQILTSAPRLHESVERLKVLVMSNASPGLCRRILKPVLLQLWAMTSKAESTDGQHTSPHASRAMLQTYLRLFGNSETVSLFLQDFLCRGSAPGANPSWEYHRVSQGDIDIVTKRSTQETLEANLNWDEVDGRAELLVNMVIGSCSAKDVSSIFLDLLQRWIKGSGEQSGVNILISDLKDEESKSPIKSLYEVTILQKLLGRAPEKLVSHFHQLLDLICQVFKADQRSRLADDLLGVVLSLLNLVITAPTFSKSDINTEERHIVESSLERLSKEDRGDLSQTASNLSLLLKYRGDIDPDDETTSAPSARQVEDRRTYNLAMNYITGTENPPPVVSEGLNLLSGMIVAESTALDITAVTVLLSKLLENNEDYINLRIVKMFTQLAGKHPRSTVKELLDHYLDSQEKASTDTRLRFGEALIQVIERLGETFAGEVASQVSETLLSIAGRRGYRPKTEAKQKREERLQELKRRKGASHIKEEDLDEDESMDDAEALTEQDKANHDILAQIVQGWDSKRGAEDVRMRTSALSIFGTALETNIGGVGPTLASGGVDLCINILAMEPEIEKGILRRAAIVAVLNFVRALHKARENNRSLGFGLTNSSREDIARTLEYVAATDNDGLVQQHARDVIESLGNWQVSTLLPTENENEGPGIGKLAGLRVDPSGSLVDAAGRPRPRIEEVE